MTQDLPPHTEKKDHSSLITAKNTDKPRQSCCATDSEISPPAISPHTTLYKVDQVLFLCTETTMSVLLHSSKLSTSCLLLHRVTPQSVSSTIDSLLKQPGLQHGLQASPLSVLLIYVDDYTGTHTRGGLSCVGSQLLSVCTLSISL